MTIFELVDNSYMAANKGALAIALEEDRDTLTVHWINGHNAQGDGGYNSSRFIYRGDLGEVLEEVKEIRKLVGHTGFTLFGEVKNVIDNKNGEIDRQRNAIANQITKIMGLEKECKELNEECNGFSETICELNKEIDEARRNLDITLASAINKKLYGFNKDMEERWINDRLISGRKIDELSKENYELAKVNEELNNENDTQLEIIDKLEAEIAEAHQILGHPDQSLVWAANKCAKRQHELDKEIGEARRIVGSEGTLKEAIKKFGDKCFTGGAFGPRYQPEKRSLYPHQIDLFKTKVVLINASGIDRTAGDTGTLINVYADRCVVKMDKGGKIDCPYDRFVKVGDTVELTKHSRLMSAPIGSLATVTGWDKNWLKVKWHVRCSQMDGKYAFEDFTNQLSEHKFPKKVKVLKDQITFPRGVYTVEADHVNHYRIKGSYVLKSDCYELT